MVTQNEPGRCRQRTDFRVPQRSWQIYYISILLSRQFSCLFRTNAFFSCLLYVRLVIHSQTYVTHASFLKTFPHQLDGSLIGNYWLLQQLYLTSCKTLLHSSSHVRSTTMYHLTLVGIFIVSIFPRSVLQGGNTPVTPLQARTFAVWTLTSAVIRFYAAYNINNKMCVTRFI